jgi:putative spermidine/putrescine transport system permease protein
MMVAALARDDAIDTRDLERKLRHLQRSRSVLALALVAPLLLFVTINFLVPVGLILFKSIDDREVSAILPRVTSAIADWDREGLPDESVFKALAQDVREADEARTLVRAGKRLNSARSGFNALINRTARQLPKSDPPSFKDALVAIDQRWGDPDYWAVIKETASPITPIYLLGAFDLMRAPDGHIIKVPDHQSVFTATWLRTIWIALVITVICVLLGYPLAYVIANASPGVANLLLILILIPFWTSLLVRTTAWLVLLQNQGVVNDFGLYLGLWKDRIQLIHNRFGVYVTMVQILLPYMVLPIYGVMKRIPRSYLRAAKSLGANPLVAFVRIYLPLTMHGIGAGALLVFILAIGFYVTPALVGGPTDQMISYFIAFYTNEVLNWGAAAALSVILLLLTSAAYYAFKVAFGLDNLQIGR